MFSLGRLCAGSRKVSSGMNKQQLKKFKTLLVEKRDEIVKKAKQTLEEDMTLDANDLPDEMDLASSEYLQSFTFRLRGREKVFLDKIEKAFDTRVAAALNRIGIPSKQDVEALSAKLDELSALLEHVARTK